MHQICIFSSQTTINKKFCSEELNYMKSYCSQKIYSGQKKFISNHTKYLQINILYLVNWVLLGLKKYSRTEVRDIF